MPTWLDAFGRERLLLLRAEDYWARPRDTLVRTLGFLDLAAPAAGAVAEEAGGVLEGGREAALSAALAKPVRVLHGSNATFWGDKSVINAHLSVAKPRHPGHTMSRLKGEMLPEARTLLNEFFGPLNARLSRQLGEEKWKWADVLSGLL